MFLLMQAAEPAGEQSAAASGSAATPEKTPESTAPPASEEQAGLKEAPAQQPDPSVAAAAVAEATPAADSEQREKVPNAPAAPSGNAFASFAASNSKGGFGTLSAGTTAASTSSGNGTSLGMLETLPPKPFQSDEHGRCQVLARQKRCCWLHLAELCLVEVRDPAAWANCYFANLRCAAWRESGDGWSFNS